MVYFLGFIFAFLASVVLTKFTIIFARKYGFVDDPQRTHGAILHTEPIPRAGGLPVYVATFIASLVLFSSNANYFLQGDILKHLIGIFVAGFFIVVLGLVDDKYDVSPKIRLGLLFLFALIVVGFGVGISYITNPLGGVFRLDTLILSFTFLGELHSIVVLADILAVFWIVSMMNAINWSSGLDGQNAGISTVALVALGFASLRYDRLSEPTALLSFIAAGAFAGFLIFSKYPQKIMPGFSGSTFSGFLIAVISILSGAKFATAFIILAIPILDAILVFSRRVYNHKNPMANDRTHLHHYLLDLGWSKRKIALFYWGLCAILGLLALQVDSNSKLFVFGSVVILFFSGVIWLRRSLQSRKQ